MIDDLALFNPACFDDDLAFFHPACDLDIFHPVYFDLALLLRLGFFVRGFLFCTRVLIIRLIDDTQVYLEIDLSI